MIQYNPDIVTPDGNMPVETYFNAYQWQNWLLAVDNLAGYIENFRRATGGLHDVKIKDHYVLNEFPPVTDGTPLTPATYLDAYLSGTIDDDADYAAILNDPRFNIVTRIESGEVDAVFLIQCNSANFNETRMAGHMAEQTLARNMGPKFPVRWQRPVFTTYDLNDPARTTGLADLTDIKRFLLTDGANYSYLNEGPQVSYFSSPGNSEVGSNAVKGYYVGPETWEIYQEYDIHGGDFLFWWYEHLPKNSGIHSTTDLYGATTTGLLNTWLPLIFDINNFEGTAVYDVAFPPVDDQPPAPVGNLQATAISSHVVELTWEEPSDNIGVTRYDVYRDGTHIAQVKSPQFTDTELTTSTTYSYTVMARDGFRNRSSASVIATTQEQRTYLSDLDWVSAVNGFRTIGIDKGNSGVVDIFLGGIRYAKGLGVHADSEIVYDIGAAYQWFKAMVGAQDGE